MVSVKQFFPGVVLILGCLFHLHANSGDAVAQAVFGPDALVRGTGNKNTYSRTFSLAEPSGFFTLTVENGAAGAQTVKKGWVTLNGQEILNPAALNRRFSRVVVAIHPRQQNELQVKLKGGDPGSFVKIFVEPTLTTILRDPADPSFDDDQAGVGVPIGVAVDQSNHRAYVSDRFWDSIIEIDVQSASINQWYKGLDGDESPGNGATTGICLNPTARTVVAVNEGAVSGAGGSLAVVGVTNGAMRVVPLVYEGRSVNAFLVAVNPENDVVAMSGFYSSGGRAYFFNVNSGALVVREEGVGLTAPVYNSFSSQFVYAANSPGVSPSLVVYNALAPFQKLRRISSSAPPGTEFERLAVNPSSNMVVAVNPRDAAVYLFDMTEGTEVGRIRFAAGSSPYSSADVAINTRTNMAAVISGHLNHVTVMNLATRLVAAEIPLPLGCRPLGIGIDNGLNRAVIAENGLASTQRNGSILVIDLPNP